MPRWIAHWRRFRDSGSADAYLEGEWKERNWLNVPGPFYGAETDTCCAGPAQAPANVLYDEFGQEFIWRQPRNSDEVRAVLDAAYQDPFRGYAWDGDDHWTAAAVGEWWANRERVLKWINDRLQAQDHPLTTTVRAFREYIEGELEDDLSRYVAWLEERSVAAGESPARP